MLRAAEPAATPLLAHLQLLFVPPGVGIVLELDSLGENALPIALAVGGSFVVTLLVSGTMLQALLRRQDRGGPGGGADGRGRTEAPGAGGEPQARGRMSTLIHLPVFGLALTLSAYLCRVLAPPADWAGPGCSPRCWSPPRSWRRCCWLPACRTTTYLEQVTC